ncbi:MAG: DUF2339 domain-containing protein [Chitinophagaceae bacterium]|nr:DUF2339 domain-containing protein [Chitinophagaceae bacterium]
MENINEQIIKLEKRLHELMQQQNILNKQLFDLSEEISRLKGIASFQDVSTPIEQKKPIKGTPVTEEVHSKAIIPPPVVKENIPQQTPVALNPSRQASRKLEEFIGGNIASKVGILITIIGVFIGAKYAIDNNLVSPLIRIISGYCAGITLVAVALWLKKKYENYSAVLLGGGLSVLYFITYIAYSYYQLLPQTTAFIVMLLVTAATVCAALVYNQPVIAHLALVGSYSIPFLLSDDSGRYHILFSYIAIINTGVLIISFVRYWKSLFYTAFSLTWLIYVSWYFIKYDVAGHYQLAWTFVSVWFILFYITFLSYKLIKKEQYKTGDVIVLLLNSFIFYGSGYALIDGSAGENNYLGMFTLVNAVVHLIVALTIRYLKLTDRALFYMILGLVMVFVTISIPVQFDGSWVTLLWGAQSAVMFWVGRTKQNVTYEKLAVALSILTVLSLGHDWMNYLSADNGPVIPFANIHFFTGLLVALFSGAIVYFHYKRNHISQLQPGSVELQYWNLAMPFILIVVLYITGHIEWQLWIEKKYLASKQEVWQQYTVIILLAYALLFVYVLAAINRFLVKNEMLAKACTIVVSFLLLFGLTEGLNTLGVLRQLHLDKDISSHVYYMQSRYFLFALILAGPALLWFMLLPYWKSKEIKRIFSLGMHGVILTLISNEFIHWMDLRGFDNQYKLSLSIIWGFYALFLIVAGIWKKRKHLRIGAIVLFAATLIKLFIYDLAGSNTITKTISFISLGVILLLVSYLYNRYKHVILMDDE